MIVTYVSCFTAADEDKLGCGCTLQTWASLAPAQRTVVVQSADSPDTLRTLLCNYLDQSTAGPSVLILGGHGHASRTGFMVRDEPLAWWDLVGLMRGRMFEDSIFIFYSCNGALPTQSHWFGKSGGPDFVFGSPVKVEADIMRSAVNILLNWKMTSGLVRKDAVSIVDRTNTLLGENSIRVIWGENAKQRHPDVPVPRTQLAPRIPILGWGVLGEPVLTESNGKLPSRAAAAESDDVTIENHDED